MKTVLDDADGWFFDSIRREATLDIHLIQGTFRKEQGKTVASEMTPTDNVTIIRFEEYISLQMVNAFFEDELEPAPSFEGHVITKLAKSGYLDYALKLFESFPDWAGQPDLYRIHAGSEIIEVMSHDPPVTLRWDEGAELDNSC